MDDPREMLRAAGVDVPEVLADYRKVLRNAKGDLHLDDDGYVAGKLFMHEYAGPAILALARLVAQYKWQRDKAAEKWRDWVEDGDWRERKPLEKYHAELDRLWKEHNEGGHNG